MTLNKAFFCLFLVLSTLFPVNFAFAGTSYTDFATWEAALPYGAAVTQIDLIGTPGDSVASGTYFSGVELFTVGGFSDLPMYFDNSTGTQVCVTGDAVLAPRFDFLLTAETAVAGAEVSGVDASLGTIAMIDPTESYAEYDDMTATTGTEFRGGTFSLTGHHFIVGLYTYTPSMEFCIGPIYITADADGDGYAADLDCDDTTASVSPTASESCNGVDDNCDGEIDESGATGETTWYVDADADGYGFYEITAMACTEPSGYVANDDDCNDTNADMYPGNPEIVCDGTDQDCDPGTSDEPDTDADGYTACGEDCNDADATVSPAAAEVPYDGVDEDCNSATPDDDLDGDNYVLASDCDDTNSGMNPGEVEVAYDGIDNDCSAATSDDDIDGDGYNLADDCDDTNSGINPGASEVAYDGIDQDCSGADLDDVDGDGSAYPDDCNDSNSRVYPGAAETCNGRDENCDGLIDEGYADSDGDGNADCVDEDLDGDTYTPADGDCDDTDVAINPAATDIPDNGIDEDCSGEDLTDADSDGYGTADGDCDDSNAAISPAATETCDGIDQDCDGTVDDNPTDGSTWYVDADADTYGDSAIITVACTQPTGYVAIVGDCDDHNNTIHSGAEDVPDDGIDQDCDGSDATTYVDTGDTGGDSGDSGVVIDTGDSGTDTAGQDTAEPFRKGDFYGGGGCRCSQSGSGLNSIIGLLIGCLALVVRRRS